MKQRILASLLAVCMVLGLLPGTARAAEIVASGACGDNLTWTLDDEDVLTISGTGDMYDYSDYSSVPWYPNRSSILSVDIAEGVTSIGNYAFYYCSAMPSVVIPDGVTSIGKTAFAGCSNLASVTIPGSVTSMGESVFIYCSKLTSAGPISDGNSYSIKFGWTTSIPDKAFESLSGLTSIVIPDGVTSIGKQAFHGCTLLKSVTIPEGMTSIGASAFATSGLTGIDIPEGVTSIGDAAFQICSSLKSVTIPGSVTSMGINVFQNCSGLTSAGPTGSNSSIEFGWTTAIPDNAFYYCSSLTSVTIPNGVTSIGDSAFYNCSSLASVDIPGSVTSMGITVFQNCRGLTSAGPIDDGNIYSIEFGWTTSIPDNAFYGCGSLTSVSIPDSVTSIGAWAFHGCSSLTSIIIPDGVTSIGGGAFRECSSLTSVSIPNSVTSIGGWAFRECSSLTSVTISDGVTSIGDSAFSECSSLASVTIPASVTTIGNWAFSNYVDSTTPAQPLNDYMVIYYTGTPAGWERIEKMTDEYGASVAEGTTICFFPTFDEPQISSGTTDPVVTITADIAFKDVVDVNNDIRVETDADLTLVSATSGSITRSGDYTLTLQFSGTAQEGDELTITVLHTAFSVDVATTEGPVDTTLPAVTVTAEPPETTIVPYPVTGGNIYFDTATGTVVSCDGSVTAADIPAKIAGVDVIAIGFYAFGHPEYACSYLTNVTIPDGVTSIEGGAFSRCQSLTNVTIPKSVTYIGPFAFTYDVSIYHGAGYYTCEGAYPANDDLVIFYNGTPNDWASVELMLGMCEERFPHPPILSPIYYLPTFSAPEITTDTTDPVVTITADIAFNETIDIENDIRVETDADLTLVSAASGTVTRSGDYTLTLQFSGTAQNGDELTITVCHTAFSVLVGAAGEKDIDTVLPAITITAEPSHTHTDADGDGYCDDDGECLHVMGGDGYCTDASCAHSSGCACGGPVPVTPPHTDADGDGYCDDDGTCLHTMGGDGYCTDASCEHGSGCTCGGPAPVTPPHVHVDADGDGYCDDDGVCLHTMSEDGYCTDAACAHSSGCACGGPAPVTPVTPVTPDLPAPTPTPAPSVTPEPEPTPESPVVVAVDDTIAAGEQETVTISGQGESDMQYIVKDGAFTDWIDRVDLPRYAIDLYTVLCIGGDNDTLYDLLIKDEYFNFSGSAGASDEEANVESVLELVSQLDTPYSSGSGLFGESSFTGGFDIIDTTAGDRSINYGELKEGDVVRTSSYNGIFVTSVAKDGNKNYDEDLKKACTYANTAFQAFDRDHPEVFWLSGKSKMRMVTVTMRQGEQTFKETYVFFVLADKDGFTVRDGKYSGQDKIEADIQRMEKAVETILKTVTAKTPNEQAAQLNRWLTEHNEYNTSENLLSLPNWPHECLSALVGSVGKEGPVCDGYSRAFKVLCGRLDIPCVLVDGYAKPSADSTGEFHMWNSAQMPDGKWYGVDVTWNDPTVKGVSGAKSGHEREDFLLVGADTVIFGLKFSESHPPKNRAADGGVAFVNGPTLSVEAFKPLAAASVLPFADVAANSWYYGAVEYVYDHDLMTGETISTFAPGGAMTRAMVWTVLGRMEGADVNGGTPWYSGAQSWAVSAEVSDGSNPGGSISREELVTMLWRAQGGPDAAADLSRFADGGSVSGWALGAMRWAVSIGLLEGSDGRLNPAGRATRAEVAAILMRFCKAR